MQTLGQKLKMLREKSGKTQQEIATILCLNRVTYTQYENDKRVPPLESLKKLAEIYNVSIDELSGRPISNHQSGIKIPVLGRVVAGIPIEAITEILDYEEITENLAATGDFFALVAKGDSMNPTIIDGDVLIIRKQDTVDDGQVGIVLIDGMDATVKRIHITAGGITLIGDNPAVFPPHFYTNDEIDTLPVKIIGKVVEIRRKMI